MSQGQPIIIKKIKKGGHGHHGGSWKVAYADFMTSMLALFIVLWVIGQSQKTRQAIAEYFRDPNATPEEIVRRLTEMEGAPKPDPRNPSPFPQANHLELLKLEKRLALALAGMQTDEGRKVTIKIERTDQGLRITLLDRAKAPFFDIGSGNPLPHTSRILRVIGKELSTVSNPVVIEGHTDKRQFQGAGYGNWELSAERANAARRLLCSGGMQGERVTEVRGYADTRLFHPQMPLDPANRRVTILVRYTRPDRRAPEEAAKPDKPNPEASPGAQGGQPPEGHGSEPPPSAAPGGH